MAVSGPAYDIVEVLHVAAAVVAFGSLGATGYYASALRRSANPGGDETASRYFRPGRNWAERALFLVPIFGGVLVGLAGRSVADHAWPWIGLGIWVVAAGVATAGIFPAERAVQDALATGSGELTISRLARRLERFAALTSVLFVAALVVMVWQPG